MTKHKPIIKLEYNNSQVYNMCQIEGFGTKEAKKGFVSRHADIGGSAIDHRKNITKCGRKVQLLTTKDKNERNI